MPRWCEPSEWVSNQSNTFSRTSGGMPGPWSVTANTKASLRRSADNVTVPPAGEKLTALARRLKRICRTRRSSAMKLPMSSGGTDVEHEAGADQPVLHAFGGRRHGGADVDRPEIELHAAGVDGRQIEDVVDQRQQRVGGDRDVVEIFALLRRQRPGTRVAEQMDEADDVGERRAQLVGHVVDEIDLDLVGVLERLVAFAQRALDVDRVGDIVERHQCGAVRQRHGPCNRPRCRRAVRAVPRSPRGCRSRSPPGAAPARWRRRHATAGIAP